MFAMALENVENKIRSFYSRPSGASGVLKHKSFSKDYLYSGGLELLFHSTK